MVESNDTIIKILVAEDIEPIRERYVRILSNDPQLEVVASVKNGYEAVMMTALKQPDVILMDIEMQDKQDGLKAAKEIIHQFPNKKVIILTVYEDEELVFSAFQLGVCNYILKNSESSSMIANVKDAYYGRSTIQSKIAEKIRKEFRRVKNNESNLLLTLNVITQLTPTELDILYLLQQHKTRREICNIRHVEMSTVKSQIHSILKKFNCKNTSEVITIIRNTNFFNAIFSNKTSE